MHEDEELIALNIVTHDAVEVAVFGVARDTQLDGFNFVG
jgi:hypothetical protein